MMPEHLSWEALTALGSLALVIATIWLTLGAQNAKHYEQLLARIEDLRLSSEEGRSKLYQRIDGIVHELRQEFATKEIFATLMKRVDLLEDRVHQNASDMRDRRRENGGK